MDNSSLIGEAYIFQLVSALIITLIAVIGIMIISKININDLVKKKK